MKKYILLLLLPFIFSCESENFNNHNPYIPNYGFTVQINTDLPTYNDLKFPGNGVYVGGYGARGIFVFNTGSGYTAYDAACPNQPLSSCSTMSKNGINAVCACDNASYSFYSGQCPGKEFPMKPYRVEGNGNLVRVYN